MKIATIDDSIKYFHFDTIEKMPGLRNQIHTECKQLSHMKTE